MFDTNKNKNATREEDLVNVTFNLHLAINALHASDAAEDDFTIYEIAKDFIKDSTANMAWTGKKHGEEWVAPLKLVTFNSLEVIDKSNARTLATSSSEIGDSGTLFISIKIEDQEPIIFSRENFSNTATKFYKTISKESEQDREDYNQFI